MQFTISRLYIIGNLYQENTLVLTDVSQHCGLVPRIVCGASGTARDRLVTFAIFISTSPPPRQPQDFQSTNPFLLLYQYPNSPPAPSTSDMNSLAPAEAESLVLQLEVISANPPPAIMENDNLRRFREASYSASLAVHWPSNSVHLIAYGALYSSMARIGVDTKMFEVLAKSEEG
jgi:hypothetical protein